jgi:hypothetical protein
MRIFKGFQVFGTPPRWWKTYVLFACIRSAAGEYFLPTLYLDEERMRPAVLSISAEKVLAPIRNAVLAHAGYGVIPASTIESALEILRDRHVCAMVIAHSFPLMDRRKLCSEGHSRKVPSVVLDPYEQVGDEQSALHVNPLDGPEAFLDALASLLLRSHRPCVAGNTVE